MTTLSDTFAIAAGSVIGREHVRCHRNNQDAAAMRLEPGLAVAAVADGCSSGRYSEVGARLATRWLVCHLPNYVGAGLNEDVSTKLDRLAADLVRFLTGTARSLASAPDDLALVVRDFFLFTLQVALIDPQKTLVFGLGDGLVSINGGTRILSAGADNAPPYLGYRLLSSQALRNDFRKDGLYAHGELATETGGNGTRGIIETLTFALHHNGPTEALRSLLIGTDGAGELLERSEEVLKDGQKVGGLEAFEQDPRYVRNPSLVQKRLVVVGELNQRLRDDTTLVLIRRKEAGSCRF